jgi:hypothetical protein
MSVAVRSDPEAKSRQRHSAEPHSRRVGRGNREAAAAGRDGTRRGGSRDYTQAWRSFYEQALEAGSSVNAARFIANEKILDLQAADGGYQRPGTGDYGYF